MARSSACADHPTPVWGRSLECLYRECRGGAVHRAVVYPGGCFHPDAWFCQRIASDDIFPCAGHQPEPLAGGYHHADGVCDLVCLAAGENGRSRCASVARADAGLWPNHPAADHAGRWYSGIGELARKEKDHTLYGLDSGWDVRLFTDATPYLMKGKEVSEYVLVPARQACFGNQRVCGAGRSHHCGGLRRIQTAGRQCCRHYQPGRQLHLISTACLRSRKTEAGLSFWRHP